MRLISFRIQESAVRYGIVFDRGIIDLSTRVGKLYPTLRDLLEAGGMEKIKSIAGNENPDFSIEEVSLLPPIPNPQKIICVGLNYTSKHKNKADLPKYPSIFIRFPVSFVGHRDHIVRPPESHQLDYEGEIAIIVGAMGRRIPQDQARRHIAGFTCMNEGSVRDWMRHGRFNVTQGKNFDRTGAMGPWLVTADEFPAFDNLLIKTRVNGEVRQNDSTANLLFSFSYLLNYISTFTTLRPGDIIATGTPAGAGAGFDPPRYLKPGDVVEIEVSGIGTLLNSVIDEPV